MVIGGLQKFSLLDYPEQIAAIVFTQGCNFRCQFCYNPMLVWPQGGAQVQDETNSPHSLGGESEKGHPQIHEDDLFRFLKSRVGKLDAVVITGGEPTMQADLEGFIKKIKSLSFKVKLDTNGTNPEMLMGLIKESIIDYIAMDIKGPSDKYDAITGVKANLKKIKKSIKIIMESKLPYEFRTTVVPELLQPAEIRRVGQMIKGAREWYLQNFHSSTDLINPSFKNSISFTEKQMNKMKSIGSQYVDKCEIR